MSELSTGLETNAMTHSSAWLEFWGSCHKLVYELIVGISLILFLQVWFYSSHPQVTNLHLPWYISSFQPITHANLWPDQSLFFKQEPHIFFKYLDYELMSHLWNDNHVINHFTDLSHAIASWWKQNGNDNSWWYLVSTKDSTLQRRHDYSKIFVSVYDFKLLFTGQTLF